MPVKVKKILIIIFLISWISLWLRNFYKDISINADETKKLFGKPLKGKWEYILGPNPSFSDNLDQYKQRRLEYFLYPNNEK